MVLWHPQKQEHLHKQTPFSTFRDSKDLPPATNQVDLPPSQVDLPPATLGTLISDRWLEGFTVDLASQTAEATKPAEGMPQLPTWIEVPLCLSLGHKEHSLKQTKR